MKIQKQNDENLIFKWAKRVTFQQIMVEKKLDRFLNERSVPHSTIFKSSKKKSQKNRFLNEQSESHSKKSFSKIAQKNEFLSEQSELH